MELYRTHRPRKLEDVVGQPDAVSFFKKKLAKNSLPHVVLLYGVSGCGKTTLARIVARKLGCQENNLNEINVAEDRGIDRVREIRREMRTSPLGGGPRVYILDEIQQQSKDGQSAILKVLEDCPKHVWFFLCTTDPNKLLATVRNRCAPVPIRALDVKELCGVVANVVEKHFKGNSAEYPPDEVIEKIAEVANGSARMAIQLLEKVIDVDSPEEQIAILENSRPESEQRAIDLCRAMLEHKPNWSKIAALVDEIKDDAEEIRWSVMGYAWAILRKDGGKKGGKGSRARLILDVFKEPFFNSKKFGVGWACAEVFAAD